MNVDGSTRAGIQGYVFHSFQQEKLPKRLKKVEADSTLLVSVYWRSLQP